MTQAKSGDTVSIHYTGTLEDGSVFDTSRDRDPLEFTLGSGQVIPGFDSMVTGMAVGDIKKETIACDQAYGENRPEMITKVDLSQFPPDLEPELGLKLQLANDHGHVLQAVITELDEKFATLDANPPLAGKDLTFEVELMEIK